MNRKENFFETSNIKSEKAVKTKNINYARNLGVRKFSANPAKFESLATCSFICQGTSNLAQEQHNKRTCRFDLD